MVGLSRMTVRPELMLTLELERDTALVPPEFGVDAIGITEAVEAEEGPQESYLKEHVVGILFSRSKLTHLQKQVKILKMLF